MMSGTCQVRTLFKLVCKDAKSVVRGQAQVLVHGVEISFQRELSV